MFINARLLGGATCYINVDRIDAIFDKGPHGITLQMGGSDADLNLYESMDHFLNRIVRAGGTVSKSRIDEVDNEQR